MLPVLKVRGFEICAGWETKGVILPAQATSKSAGYDFFAPETLVIPPNLNSKPTLVPTGVKAYMRPSEFLMLANRSSNPKNGLLLANGIGVVDSDYYGNAGNDGHIMFAFWNVFNQPIYIEKGEKLGQGIFVTFSVADDGNSTATRKGGFGSTDEK